MKQDQLAGIVETGHPGSVAHAPGQYHISVPVDAVGQFRKEALPGRVNPLPEQLNLTAVGVSADCHLIDI